MAEAPGEYEDSEYDQEMEPEEDHESLKEYVRGLREKDAILEPGIFKLFEDFVDMGGEQKSAIRHLASGYKGGPLMINSLIDWLHSAGCRKKEIQALAEEHLKQMILKHFDPKKADLIFTEEGSTPDWLESIISFQTWRELFYQLSDQYPDCLMLKFTIKLISDAGYQGEITSVTTAAHQPEVFCGILKTLLTDIITTPPNAIDEHFNELCSLVCQSQHTYFYCQGLIMTIQQRHQEYKHFTQWLSGEIQQYATSKNLDVTTMSLHFNHVGTHYRIFEALGSMLSRDALNPADVSTLYKCYTEEDKPSVSYLRNSQFLDLLVHTLFKPGCTINPEHRDKYIYLLAYAVSVYEQDRYHDNSYNGETVTLVTDELSDTQQAIETAHTLCSTSHDLYTELLTKINTLFKCIRYPIVSLGVLRWVESILTDQSFFDLSTETSSLFLVLLDEVYYYI